MYLQLYEHFDDFESPKKICKPPTSFNRFEKTVSVADEEKHAMGTYRLLYRSIYTAVFPPVYLEQGSAPCYYSNTSY